MGTMPKRLKRLPIDMIPVSTIIVDAKGYLELVEARGFEIQRVTLVPAKLGSRNFGKFKVEFDSPIFQQAS